MFKKTMTFDDLEGNETTQTFYFNFTKKEVAELLEFEQLEEKLERLTTPPEVSGLSQVENNQMAYDTFQDLILRAYGEKGADNVTFVKNQRTREYLESHVAFVEIIFEFLEKPALAAEFIERCLPPKLVAQAKTEMAKENPGMSSETLHEMMLEAERRQQDPATRIEPGIEAAREALGENPEVEALAVSIAEQQKEKPKELTPEDVMSMSDEDFERLDPKKLSAPALQAAFARKTRPKA